MNGPCKIFFHEDTAPLYGQLPERYSDYVCDRRPGGDEVLSLLAQHAFYIDFTHGVILRVRVVGERDDDPIDFPTSSVAWIEWYYGANVPPPLTPRVGRRA